MIAESIPLVLRRGSACAKRALALLPVALAPLLVGPLRGESLSDLSFEDLAQVQIYTASKHAESLANTAAAVTVVTGEEIRRNGASSIPEALRGVPGLSVAQINGFTWGIGARGFSNQFASKLLVMINGRSVYTPVFGGVFWDAQDALMEDVERIEVVLGPGGSLWGANAMNGVINILTKDAHETQGSLLYFGVADHGHPFAGARLGWQLSRGVHARVYLKEDSSRSFRLTNGTDAGDATHSLQTGFRVDGGQGEASVWTLQGDAYWRWNDYRVAFPSLAVPPGYTRTDKGGEYVSGTNLLGAWEHSFEAGSSLRAQVYLDQNRRAGPIFNVNVRTADLDLQHSLAEHNGWKVDWGAAIRHTWISTTPGWISFSPPSDNAALESLFAQARQWLVPEKLSLTAGLKLEYSDDSGFSPQPSAKLAWTPVSSHTTWLSWARAVRTPAYTELNNRTDAAVFPPGVLSSSLPGALRGIGVPSLDAEKLAALDAGWRWRASSSITVTLTGFFNEYHSLIKVHRGTPFVQTTPVPAVIVPMPEDNDMFGKSYGGELSFRWQVHPGWRLDLGADRNFTSLKASSADPIGFTTNARSAPRSAVYLNSTWNFLKAWEITFEGRNVTSSPKYGIHSYYECDLRLAWQPGPHWEIALSGHNLLHNYHRELNPSLIGAPAEVPREFRLATTCRF